MISWIDVLTTYVSETQFTIAGDLSAEFCPGRRVVSDCGTDGYRQVTVNYSVHADGVTTVRLAAAFSQELTANLVKVALAATRWDGPSDHNLPAFANASLSLQQVRFERNDYESYSYVNPGWVCVDGRFCFCPGFNHAAMAPPENTWHYIYVAKPQGFILQDYNLYFDVSQPLVDPVRYGFYHPVETGHRCIGAVLSDANNQIIPFVISGNIYLLDADPGAYEMANQYMESSQIQVTMNQPVYARIVIADVRIERDLMYNTLQYSMTGNKWRDIASTDDDETKSRITVQLPVTSVLSGNLRGNTSYGMIVSLGTIGHIIPGWIFNG